MPISRTIRALAVVAAAQLSFGFALAANDAAPRLDVVLKPTAVAGAVNALTVQLKVEALNVEQGKAVLRMPLRLAGITTASYSADAIQASDANGALKLTAVDEPANPSGQFRQYQADRTTVGPVTFQYTATPRAVDATTRNGPLFDLRSEAGGLVGSGIYFMALPANETSYRIKLSWDLSSAPKGTRGVWSFGEGTQERVSKAEGLAYSYYATGAVKSPKSIAGKGNFGFYWLSDAPFDMDKLAVDTQSLYRFMANFFDDADASYAVFGRRNPYPAGGGTALYQSFMFGYGPNGEDTLSGGGGHRQMLLAHEMAHNWPTFKTDDHTNTAWYTEGTAEFYSSTLSYRAGVVSLDDFLKVSNDRADGYYSNPLHTLDNAEAGKRFWSDTRAQRVPYGKGFMYLVNLDAKLREKSGGKRRLDDLVKEVLKRQRAGEKVELAEWRQILVRELGAEGTADLDDMAAGKEIVPHPKSFAPCLRPVKSTFRPFDPGFDELSLGKVRALRAGSEAEKAGVKEGDTILSIEPSLYVAIKDEKATVKLKLQRGDSTFDVQYLPRGEVAHGWRWERVPGVKTDNCQL